MGKIIIKDLTANYGAKTVIRSLCFTLDTNCFSVLTGNNGIGKSTLFKCIKGLSPYTGDIVFPFSKFRIAYLAQKQHPVFEIKVIDLVLMGRFSHNPYGYKYATKDYQIAEEKLNELGIIDLRDKFLDELSGGQQQLVWLAQLMVQEADLYLLDEPLQYLDLKNRKLFLDAITRFQQNQNTTVCISCHEMSLLNHYEGRIYYMHSIGMESYIMTSETIEKVESKLLI